MIVQAVLLMAGQSSAPLVNPELRTSLNGWETTTYGAKPKVSFSDGLVVRSDEPSDTAIGQNLQLAPNVLYRLRALVRTRDLKPVDAGVYGNVQVQAPNGGTIAQGTNLLGTTPWTPETVYFLAPPDGNVRIALFFCGFGKGTGEASFRDLSLDQVDPSNTPVKVTREALGKDPISPLQYGQFIEYLCDLVPGMWSERLCDGSFEGLTPYKFEYIKETDFRQHPWYPYGETDKVTLVRDTGAKVGGESSGRIDLAGPARCSGGVVQDGIPLKGGETLYFSTWVKGTEIGQFYAELIDGRSVIRSAPLTVDKEWTKVHFTFRTDGETENAKLAITFKGPGSFWLDSASLMPAETMSGWRPDVVHALTALKPGIIRVGGSVLDDANLGTFEWKDTIGDADFRTPFRAWGGLQTPGAGLEEVVQLIQMVHAEPLICLRYEGKTPQDAADEVEYFNGSTSTPMGAVRAKNGHAEPYRIRYWQIGNERWGQAYWEAVPKFAEAIRKVDPSVQVLSSFPSSELVRGAAPEIDFVSPHQYDIANLQGTRQELEDTARIIRDDAGGKQLHAAITEWNTTAGDRGLKRATLWDLKNALACSRYHNLLHRYADLVKIANRSNLTNSFCSGIIQTRGARMYLTPTYFAQWLYSNLAGTIPLKVDGDLPADISPDISATLSTDRTTLSLFVVNESPNNVVRPLDLSAFKFKTLRAEQYVLTDSHPDPEESATNSLEDPNRVTPVRSSVVISSPSYRAEFLPYSLTVLRFSVAG